MLNARFRVDGLVIVEVARSVFVVSRFLLSISRWETSVIDVRLLPLKVEYCEGKTVGLGWS